jgi:trypsin-like peptidase
MHRRCAASRRYRLRAIFLIVCIAPLLAPSGAKACEDRSVLAHAAVGITRMFDESEKQNLAGVAGTGWFLAPRLLVTVAHVTQGMRLSEGDWKPLLVRDGDAVETIDVRLQRIVGEGRERIALIEMSAPLGSARSLVLRKEPLVAEERVISRAYRNDSMRNASGRFVEYGKHGRFAGGALFEIYDGDDRMVLDYGASGAPVLDCSGRVVAVVANLMTQTIGGSVRVSTAWSMPNVLTVPIAVLRDETN